MKTLWNAGHFACRITAIALLILSTSGLARAQVGVGVAYPGVPFLYYTPQQVPSPTDYLYERDRATISAYGNALQQQAAASSMASATSSPNAYYNRMRDYSGEETYHVQSRQTISRRSSPPPKPATTRSTVLPLDAYFLANGPLDWPRDAPDSAALHSARVEAEMAVRDLRDEIRSSGKAKAQTVGAAKRKVANYGQRALVEVKSARSRTVAVLFHYFLLFLNQSLDEAAATGTS